MPLQTTRYFKLKKNRGPRKIEWLNCNTVYEGELLSMINRTARLYGPGPVASRPHIDVSYDWLIPVQRIHR